jgi:hypothetical protein
MAGGSAFALVGGVAADSKASPAPPKLTAEISIVDALSLKDAHGKAVGHLSSGWYTLTIKDSVYGQRFELKGPGINRSTGKHFVGAAIWGIQLHPGTYTYESIGAKNLKRSFSVR